MLGGFRDRYELPRSGDFVTRLAEKVVLCPPWKPIWSNTKPDSKRITIEGGLCPACRQYYRELNLRYRGDWTKIISHAVDHRTVRQVGNHAKVLPFLGL